VTTTDNRRVLLFRLADEVSSFLEAAQDGRDVPEWVQEYVDRFKAICDA
jgi:hypothetical protein